MNHQPILLSKLKEPSYFDNDGSLYIGNRGLEQLNIFPTNDNNKSLFNILGRYKTPMGRRYLMTMLCNPLICPKMITDRYNVIELLLRDNNFEKINVAMNNIIDIPKMYRKMELNKIHPFELVSFYRTFYQIMNVIKIIRNIEDTSVRKVMKTYLNIDKEMYENVKTLVNYMSDIFDMEYMEKINYNNYTEETKNYINDNNIITPKANFNNINELAQKIDTSNNFMDLLVETLEGYIEEKNNKVIINHLA
jgi:DNA mismatch repair ATPase MutS